MLWYEFADPNIKTSQTSTFRLPSPPRLDRDCFALPRSNAPPPPPPLGYESPRGRLRCLLAAVLLVAATAEPGRHASGPAVVDPRAVTFSALDRKARPGQPPGQDPPPSPRWIRWARGRAGDPSRGDPGVGRDFVVLVRVLGSHARVSRLPLARCRCRRPRPRPPHPVSTAETRAPMLYTGHAKWMSKPANCVLEMGRRGHLRLHGSTVLQNSFL